MASSVANKSQNFLRGGRMENDFDQCTRILHELSLEPRKFVPMNSREGLPNSFQRNQNHHKTIDPDEIEEIEQFFNKKFAFKPPESGWSLPDTHKMFISERWEVEDMMKMKDELNIVKNKLNNFDLDTWHKHTKAMNKAGNVIRTVRQEINAEFVTQAWCKFYEICTSYNFVSDVAQEEGSLNTVHLCEAPGAFITSLNHYLKLNHPDLKWKWISTTLNPYYEGNPLMQMINDDRFILHTMNNWKFGEDYTGNLMDPENLLHIVREAKNLGPVLLITADGSIDCQSDPGEQESIVSQLIYCEVVSALHILSGGGNFVVKMFTMYEAETICLMYLLACCFESVNVYKPATSKEGNSENYVVCLHYKGVVALKPWLQKLLSKFSPSAPKEVMFSLDDIPDDFMDQQKACAEKFKKYQIEVIERNIYLFGVSSNQQSLKKIKRLSFLVAEEYINRYRLKKIPEECQIVGVEKLRKTEMPNVPPKAQGGSFNDLQEKQKIRGLDKIKILWDDMKRSHIDWKFDGNIKWLEFEKWSNEFKIVTGKPVTSVYCSKFCFGNILTIRNEIANLAREVGYNKFKTEPSDSQTELYTEELSSEVKQIINDYNPNFLKSAKVLNYKEKLWVSLGSGRNEAFERKAFDDIMDLIDTMWRDESFVLQGYPMLTQFTVGVIYLIGHLFERVGFIRPLGQDFAVIFQKFRSWDPRMEDFVWELGKVIDELEVDKSVLAVIPLKNLVLCHGEFYKSVTIVNSLCVQEQVRDIVKHMFSKEEQSNERNGGKPIPSLKIA